MAIPGTPQQFNVQQGNQQVYLSWSPSVGATSYSVQRSLDNVTFTAYATPATADYLDTAVTLGTQYWYKIAAVSIDGTSTYTPSQWAIPAPVAEFSLGELRLLCQQKADRVNSDFVTLPEWNNYINLALEELYDLLVTSYEDYFMAPRARFTTTGDPNTIFSYPLPNGSNTFQDINGSNFIPKAFYKILGVDLALNTSQNAFVTINKFNFIDRNNFVYPNSTSTMYGVFNMRYRIMGNNIEIIPVPSANQIIQLCYIPRLDKLLKDTDITTVGFSGWLQYAIVRAAKYALDKEESDTAKLDSELVFLKDRIEAASQGRDAGQPNTISNTRSNNFGGYNGNSGGWSGSGGGF